MEPKLDAQLRTQAEKVYTAVGLEMPEEREEAARFAPRVHGGCVLVSTFHPTPKGPELNRVHGPLAAEPDSLDVPIVGFPMVGAGAEARMRAEIPAKIARRAMEVEGESDAGFEDPENKLYFYPKRMKKGGAIGKSSKRLRPTRHPKNKRGAQFV